MKIIDLNKLPQNPKFYTKAEDETQVVGEELSTEERSRFNNNLKEINKSEPTRISLLDPTPLNSMVSNPILEDMSNEETAKITYKHISKSEVVKTQIKINTVSNKKENEGNYFWFAAYDKLIKEKNLKKIFDFFSDESELNIKREFEKDQPIILKDFEIYFDTTMNFTKPFLRQKKVNSLFIF